MKNSLETNSGDIFARGACYGLQSQLMNSRFANASILQSTQQQQPSINVALQPSYSNNSSASTNLMIISSFDPSFDLAMETAPSSNSFEPLQLSILSQDEEDDGEESRIPQAFNRDIILHRQWVAIFVYFAGYIYSTLCSQSSLYVLPITVTNVMRIDSLVFSLSHTRLTESFASLIS